MKILWAIMSAAVCIGGSSYALATDETAGEKMELNLTSEQSDKIKKCITTELEQLQRWTDLGARWTVEPVVTAQLIRYSIPDKKISINTPGLGTGVTFKFYPRTMMVPIEKKKEIWRIKPECRATSFDHTDKLASSIFSLGPVFFLSKSQESPEINLQIAVIFAFLENLIQIGVGWNVTEPSRGETFVLIGIGTGFSIGGQSHK